MPKYAIPRLLSVILVAGYAPIASAEVPTSIREQSLEAILPGVLDDDDDDDEVDEGPAEGDDTAGADAAETLDRSADDGAAPESTDDGEEDGELDEGAGAEDVAGEEPSLPGRAPAKSKGSKKSKKSKKSKGSRSKSSKKKATAKKSGSGASGTSAKTSKKRPKGAKECDYRTPIYEHEVVKGEHLGAIAGRYGVRRSNIIDLNPGLKKNPNLLRLGQKLRICPEITPHSREQIEHVVQKGENPTAIAKRYGITAEELIGLQKGSLGKRLSANAKSLRAGDSLVVFVDVEAQPEFAPVEESGGVLRASVKLPSDSKHYLVKRPNLAYGTARTIKAIKAAISRYKQRKPKGPRVHVGDISKKGGGPLKPHRSHQKGVDVDIGLVHRGMLAGEKRFVAANPQTLDVARTWALIKAFADTKEVRAVFLDYGVQKTLYEYARRTGVSSDTLDELFQYPRGKGHAHGLIRHWRGHRNHFHVRFRG